MPALERLRATRVVATPAALDPATWPAGALALRLASDEMLLVTDEAVLFAGDPHAIAEREDGFAGVWLPAAQALDFLARHSEWAPPRQRPAFAQGAVAGIPAKVWFEPERVLFVVPAPYAADFEERMA